MAQFEIEDARTPAKCSQPSRWMLFLCDVRSIFEPLLIYHEFGVYKGIRGSDFRRRILHWRQPCIDTTFFVLDAVRAFDRELAQRVFSGHRGDILSFIKEHWDKESGGFRQCISETPTVYATNMAISTLQLINNGGHYARPLGYNRAAEMLESEEMIEANIDFIMKCRKNGGFVDSPRLLDQRLSIRTTHAAIKCLWYLGREKDVANDVSKMLESEKFFVVDDLGGGFSEVPGGVRLSCSSYYATRILQILNERKWISSKAEVLEKFIENCWTLDLKGESGGFRAQPTKDSKMTLFHTTMCLATLRDILGKDLPSLEAKGIRKELILNYVWACHSRSEKGFKFRRGKIAGVRWFGPNHYQERNVLDLLRLLNAEMPRPDQLMITKNTVDAEKLEVFRPGYDMPYYEYSIGGKPVKPSRVKGIVSRFLRTVWSAADFMLLPKDTLGELSFTPIHYYILGLIGTLWLAVTVWIAGSAGLDWVSASLLMLGPLMLLVTGCAEIALWFAVHK